MSFNRCVRCGSCLKVCPIFDVTKEEKYSPRGKTYLLQVMDLIEDDEEAGREFRRLLFECTMCGRCKEICDSDVDLLEVWHKQRGSAIEKSPQQFDYLKSLKKALSSVKNIYGLPEEDRAVYWLDEIELEIPDIGEKVYEAGKTADTMIFLGCLMSFRANQMDVVRALFEVLEHLESDYLVMGAEEFCCGHPLHLMGDDEAAEDLRKHNREIIEAASVKQVVTCCPGCLIQLSQYHNFKNVEVLHHTEYLDHLIDEIPEYNQNVDMAYHDPCELHRISNVKKEPRSLLRKMVLDFREMDLSCCGGGGLLRMTDPDLSDKIMAVKAKREELADTVVVTCCPSCREQFLANDIQTHDIVELLADIYKGEGR